MYGTLRSRGTFGTENELAPMDPSCLGKNKSMSCQLEDRSTPIRCGLVLFQAVTQRRVKFLSINGYKQKLAYFSRKETLRGGGGVYFCDYIRALEG
jgi:hypothetical protein